MVTTQFFNGSMTSAEMKSLYKKLALTWHPDICKDVNATRIMQSINSEYSYWYARVSSEEVYTKKTQENPDKEAFYRERYYSREYLDSLEAMINWIYSNNIDRVSGIEIDLVGVFVWIAGITPEMVDVRAKIKAVGFQGSWKYHDDGSRTYMWKWTPEIRRFGANPNIDSIKRAYGDQDLIRKNTSPTRKALKG